MTNRSNMIPIAGRLHCVAEGEPVCGSDEVLYEPEGQTAVFQSELNKRVADKLPASVTNPFNGLGRVVLPMHLVDVEENDTIVQKNVLTQTMINQANTIYVIQYDFTLDEDITVPANCMLEFNGGSISGEHTITGNNTGIDAGLVKIFSTDVTLAGTWNVAEVYPEWFGALPNVDSTNAIQNAFYFGARCVATVKMGSNYIVTDSIDIPSGGISVEGVKDYYTVTIKKDFDGNLFTNTSGIPKRGVNIKNIRIDCLKHTGSVLKAGANSDTNRFSPLLVKGCNFWNCDDIAFDISDTWYGVISECFFEREPEDYVVGANTMGIRMGRTNALTIEKCSFYRVNYGIQTSNQCTACKIINCTFQGSDQAIYLGECMGMSIDTCYFEDAGDSNHALIEINSNTGITIIGNYVAATHGAKHFVEVSSNYITTDLLIAGNRVPNNAVVTGNVKYKLNRAEGVTLNDKDATIDPGTAMIHRISELKHKNPSLGEFNDSTVRLVGDVFNRINDDGVLVDRLIWNKDVWKKQGFLFGYAALLSTTKSALALPSAENHTEVPVGFRIFLTDENKNVYWNGSHWVYEDGSIAL